MCPVYKCPICGRYVTTPVHCGRKCIYLMSDSQREALSRLMSALLRHIPHEAGIKLDNEGFVSIEELVKGIRERWRNRDLYRWVTEDHVRAIVELDPRGRFEIRDNKIRATYGHSVKVDIKYVEDREVKVLYHGTTRDRLDSILRQGIVRGRRLYVHLTDSIEIAKEIGKRHGSNVVVLEVDVECLRKRGFKVYRASRTIYLTEYVPPECIKNVIYV